MNIVRQKYDTFLYRNQNVITHLYNQYYKKN